MKKSGPRHAKRRRAKIAPKRRSLPGTSPGTLNADPLAPKPVLSLISYGEGHFEERRLDKADDVAPFLRGPHKLWLDVEGLGDAETVRRIGELFALHPLALEDVLNVHQRAKAESYGTHLFVVLRMASRDEERLETEQAAIFLGERFVITFQEDLEGDSFEPVRERLRTNNGRMRLLGSDYLAYALIDAIVDHYFPVLERYGDRLDVAEEQVIAEPTRQTLDVIHEMKRELLTLRKSFWPLREAINGLVRDAHPLIKDETRLYLRDILDHITQIIDIIETYREIVSGLMDVYLSSLSNRMNEVMKLLTVISTIFIPLTFIAGIYGMNFDPKVSPWNMPELEWAWGYPFALLLMGGTAAALLVFFRRKGWLGGADVLVPPKPDVKSKGPTVEEIHPW
ncbi:magnesium/cobalt transporter CorA [Myxococcota bacterium]|nr:magnesium/cobalt transporter CorA [Myxococcota bacterium]